MVVFFACGVLLLFWGYSDTHTEKNSLELGVHSSVVEKEKGFNLYDYWLHFFAFGFWFLVIWLYIGDNGFGKVDR